MLIQDNQIDIKSTDDCRFDGKKKTSRITERSITGIIGRAFCEPSRSHDYPESRGKDENKKTSSYDDKEAMKHGMRVAGEENPINAVR